MPPVRRNGTTSSRVCKSQASKDRSRHNTNKMICDFCKSDTDDELKYGKLIRRKKTSKSGDITCHYYCLLFAAALSQRHDPDRAGLFGFAQEDIEKELKRGDRIKCRYCHKPGATIGCNLKSCKVSFHLVCGMKNNSFHKFDNEFASYCQTHRPLQNQNDLTSDDQECGICYETKDKHGKIDYTVMITPCCKRWLHRNCVQMSALNAGIHFFKCPLCSCKETFVEEMKKFGIHVPDQDASWEMGNAFREQLVRHSQCDAEPCQCPQGRTFKTEMLSREPQWRLLICQLCASNGTHIQCSNLRDRETSWVCDTCRPGVNRYYNRENRENTNASANANTQDETSPSGNNINTNTSYEIFRPFSIIGEMIKLHRRLQANPNLPSNKRPCLDTIDLADANEDEDAMDEDIQFVSLTSSNTPIRLINIPDTDESDSEEIKCLNS